MELVGSRNYWGFSPWIQIGNEDETKLLIGAGDIRHVVNGGTYYFVENCLESLGRHLLLLAIMLDEDLERDSKVRYFMEIYGNVLITKEAKSYFDIVCKRLIQVFDGKEKSLEGLFGFDDLKYRERDYLMDMFKRWTLKDPVFDVKKLRDQRIRNQYKERYDVRENLYDWDYTMEITQVPKSDKTYPDIIHKNEYSHWRETGVAFRFTENDEDNCVPNRSFESSVLQKVNNRTVGFRGYWGDIICSPYPNFGLKCPDKDLFKKGNDQYHFTSSHIVRSNIGDRIDQLMKLKANNQLKFNFMMMSMAQISQRSKFHQFFDSVFVGCLHSQWIKEIDIQKILKPNAKIYMESGQFLRVILKEEQRKAFVEKIREMTKNHKWTIKQKEKDGVIIFQN